ncbi:MAG: hypothetical protein ACXU9U_01030 [Parachlamydiaceae bacterium]
MSCLIKPVINYINQWQKIYPKQAPVVATLLIASLGNSVAKLGASVFALFPYNTKTKLNAFAHDGLGTKDKVGYTVEYSAKHVLPSVLCLIVRFFNPYSNLYGDDIEEKLADASDFFDKLDYLHEQEFDLNPLTTIAYGFFKKAIKASRKTEDKKTGFLDLKASGLFSLGTVTVLVAKGAELILGVGCGILAMATFGTIPQINALAMRYLSALDVIDDVTAGLLAIVNPWREHGKMGCAWYPNDGDIFDLF